MKYRALYKCRLCGAEYGTPLHTTDRATAEICMTYANGGVRGAHILQPNLTETHYCNGGGLGLSDFLGWKAEAET